AKPSREEERPRPEREQFRESRHTHDRDVRDRAPRFSELGGRAARFENRREEMPRREAPVAKPKPVSKPVVPPAVAISKPVGPAPIKELKVPRPEIKPSAPEKPEAEKTFSDEE